MLFIKLLLYCVMFHSMKPVKYLLQYNFNIIIYVHKQH